MSIFATLGISILNCAKQLTEPQEHSGDGCCSGTTVVPCISEEQARLFDMGLHTDRSRHLNHGFNSYSTHLDAKFGQVLAQEPALSPPSPCCTTPT